VAQPAKQSRSSAVILNEVKDLCLKIVRRYVLALLALCDLWRIVQQGLIVINAV